jgi:hypothetical protein
LGFDVDEKRSRFRRRAFCIILECKGFAGSCSSDKNGARRLTEDIELVKTRVLQGYRRSK